MRKSFLFVISYFVFCMPVMAAGIQDTAFTESAITLDIPDGTLYGTLATPANFDKIPVALLVAGSGATDRNGNNPQARNAGLEKLAHALALQHIATVRFDKRGIGESRAAMKSERDIRFEDYINDVKGWIELLLKDKRFSKVIVIGHSEGSLLGMAAVSETNAAMFISIAGSGQPAGTLIKDQLKAQSTGLYEAALPVIDSLEKGFTVKKIDLRLLGFFRPSVQPYFISWFKYDPQQVIKKVKVPVMIIQGTNDIQIPVEDAQRLKAAKPSAKLLLIQNMNHVFRIVEGDRTANGDTYNKPELPLADGLVAGIAGFIHQHK